MPTRTTKDVERFVTPGPRLTAAERFDIYRSGYHARLVECLLDDYPVLAAMLDRDDEGQFGALCRAYVDRHPSASPNLNGFGRHMAVVLPRGEARGLPRLRGARRGSPRSSPRSSGRSSRCCTRRRRRRSTSRRSRRCRPRRGPARASSAATRFASSASSTRSTRCSSRTASTRSCRTCRRPRPTRSRSTARTCSSGAWTSRPRCSASLEPLVAGQVASAKRSRRSRPSATDPEVLAQTGANLMVWFREWVDAGFFTRVELEAATDMV